MIVNIQLRAVSVSVFTVFGV